MLTFAGRLNVGKDDLDACGNGNCVDKSDGHTRDCDEGYEWTLQVNDPERGQGMFEYASDETRLMTVRLGRY